MWALTRSFGNDWTSPALGKVIHERQAVVSRRACPGLLGERVAAAALAAVTDAIMSDDQRAANDRMTVCVSRSLSEQIVLDL